MNSQSSPGCRARCTLTVMRLDHIVAPANVVRGDPELGRICGGAVAVHLQKRQCSGPRSARPKATGRPGRGLGGRQRKTELPLDTARDPQPGRPAGQHTLLPPAAQPLRGPQQPPIGGRDTGDTVLIPAARQGAASRGSSPQGILSPERICAHFT